MRLTLRTLLSWLDDMLPADEVRTIGLQVEESTYARELVERIRKVTRQRRLTVPASTGPEGADPNLVADYLDNVLPASQVADYERLCLRSDVNLAEAASAHQILSLLGQRAKVPAEARYRMYHLVKGREALGERARRSEAPVKPEPVAAEVPTWKPETAPTADWRARFPKLAAAAALGILLTWSTWESLRPRDLEPSVSQFTAPAGGPLPAQAAAFVAANAEREADAAKAEREVAAAKAQPGGAPAARAVPDVDAAAETPPSEVVVDPALTNMEEPEPEPAPPRRAAAFGSVEATSGLLLRRKEPGQPWQRVAQGMSVEPGELLVGIEPFRTELKFGDLAVRLVERSVVRILEPANQAPVTIELVEGRVVVSQAARGGRVELALGEARVGLLLPANVPVGLERSRSWQPGQLRPVEPGLLIVLPEGDLTVTQAGTSKDFTGPVWIALSPSGQVREPLNEPAPDWVIETEAPVVREEAGRQFLRFFKADQPPLTNLVEATTSDSKVIQELAFDALGVMGQLSVIGGALHAPDQPDTRHAAIATLRKVLARGEESLNRLREELLRSEGSPTEAAFVESLLRGVTAEDLAEDARRSALLEGLEHPDVGIRELALDNLMRATNRADSLGYDPDNPSAAGLRAWRELLQNRGTENRTQRKSR